MRSYSDKVSWKSLPVISSCFQKGDIWSNTFAELTITFNPQVAKKYHTTAYLEIDGLEKRVPLFLTGDGIGAQLTFSYDTIDLGHIFLGSTHSYEVSMRLQ